MALDAIGLVAGGLGIFSFLEDNLGANEPEGVALSIKIGSKNPDTGLGGGIEAVYAWDIDNRYLGQGDGQDVDVADYPTIVVDSFHKDMQAEYVGIAATDDAVCIAWVNVNQPDGSSTSVWTGDIASECDQSWTYNNQQAGNDDDGERHFPNCAWLDADHSEGLKAAALKFNVAAYNKDNSKDTADDGAACDKTFFDKDAEPINDAPEKRSKRLAPPKRKAWLEDSLTVSNITKHKAKALCESKNSYGRDFVGSDGYFCDMSTHTLTPLCSTKNVDGCINLDDSGSRLTRRSIGLNKRATDSTHRQYNNIQYWE